MHIHKIDKQIHSQFLKENRQDPITGDLIVEGDEVVFCANCKSAFLKDTWLYLDQKHCNQNQTIKNLVFIQNLVLAKSKKDSIFLPLEGASSFRKFSKQTKNTYWTTEYESLKNNIVVTNEREGTSVIILISTAMYIAIMFSLDISFGLFGIFSAPLFFLLVRYYLNSRYSSNKDKAMIGISENEFIIYFSKKKKKSFIAYKHIEKININYQSEQKSKLKIEDKDGKIIKLEIQTALVKKLLISISERNKQTLIELASFPIEYQTNNFFWQLYENPLLRLV